MSVITMYGRTPIKCLNMPHTNNTLVVTNYNGIDIRFLICGEQIAEQVDKDRNTKRKVYKQIKDNYQIHRTLFVD